MLDAETKRRIDTCRDILVGKVPDPKSQVEQITIALIYKFMDDMDREAEDLGGRRSFFAGDFAHYGWARLKAPELSGKEKLDLYADAIGRMNENPGIPPLFRDIFKNAYLPYRDPETLRAFLKEIDGFTYDHSERLGDAFEYLLSVLGSQGDAGQFRTPRHIIDFMVEVIAPQKHESILDPACGTAGFLISAWKYILRQNTTGTPNPPRSPLVRGEENTPSPDKGRAGEGLTTRPGDRLTPDERQTLAANIRGYDISPDMVRLSLVNLYLHGFTDPHIVEYDTLTSEERWNETADVILANPPFMSPKGGIKPHKRFSVQATRSEVLFVDYMAEHLSPNGRAAIVVPEGIIFQSGTAYKKLREMLVKNSLIAVVSLPAGVFNPYSGVKTSILILDRRRAKSCDSVLFVKVENDGFGLGAQRRAVDGSDLPEAKRLLEAFFAAPEKFENGATAHKVKRATIGGNGEWNLSGERYRTNETSERTKWPMVDLGKIARLINGRAYKQEELLSEGPTPVLRVGNFFSNRGWYYSDLELDADKYCNAGDLLYAWSASFGPKIWEGPRAIYHYHIWKIEPTDAVDKMFLFHLLAADSENIKAEGNGIAMVHATKGGMEQRKFPLPPLAIQQEIVAEIEGYQKIVDGARQVVENYRPRIDVQPDWPLSPLGELFSGIQYGSSAPLNTDQVGFKTFRMNELPNGVAVDNGEMKYSDISAAEFEKYRLNRDDILFNRTNSIEHVGRTGIFDLDGDYCFASYLIRLTDCAKLALPRYVALFMNTDSFQTGIKQFASRAIGQANINAQSLKNYRIPLPPLETQRAIVAEIEAEQALVDANKQLIARFEAKIKAVIDRVWGGDTSVPPVPPSA